jgi:hypothetical protein
LGLHTAFFVTYLGELNAQGVKVSLDPQFDTTKQCMLFFVGGWVLNPLLTCAVLFQTV